jgi:hypothetical protein
MIDQVSSRMRQLFQGQHLGRSTGLPGLVNDDVFDHVQQLLGRFSIEGFPAPTRRIWILFHEVLCNTSAS